MTAVPLTRSIPERNAGRALARQVLLVAAIGMQFGILEAWYLQGRGFAVTLRTLAGMAAGHAAVGLALSLPFLALMLLPRSRLPAVLTTSVQIAPSLFALFSMAVITANVREDRTVLHLFSVAWDLGILIAVIALGWTWVRGGWGRRVVLGLGAAIVLADVVGVSVTQWPATATSSEQVQAGRADENAPNIIFFLVDTLRADHLGIYGYSKPTSPHIDALARESAVFDRAYAAGNCTRPSMASMHTSTMPSRHGVVAIDTGLPPSLPLLAERFQGMGYATAFFTSGVNFSPAMGYSRGVEHFDVAQSSAALERTSVFSGFVLRVFPELRSRLRQTTGSSSPDERNEKVLEWVRSIGRERPVFLYVHYMGPHTPYSPPPHFSAPFSDRLPGPRWAHAPERDAGRDALAPEDREQMIAQYDGEILMHDSYLNSLLSELRALGWLDNAIVVVTADHGEAFGEHGLWTHGRGLFEELVRVPLIVWSSLPWNQHRRLQVPVGLIDLAPTLVDLAGGDIPEAWDGNSLRPWLVGDRSDVDRVVFQEDPPWAGKALRTEEWAYLESSFEGASEQWLYAGSDFAQENDLSKQYPLQVQEFHQLVNERAEIDSTRQAGAIKLELDEATKEKLKALGYVD